MLLSSVLPLSSGDVSVELDVVCHVHGCKKNAEVCSMWCECINCLNTATPEPATDTSLLHLSLEEEIADNLTEEVGDIMGWVFGNVQGGSSNTQNLSDLED